MADGSAHDFDQEETGAFAAGWSAQDVDVLEEMVSLSMQLMRGITRSVAIRNERAERDETAAPLSQAEASKAHLDFVRLSRSVRVTLVLKAHALGAKENPVRLMRGGRPDAAADNEDEDEDSDLLFPPCPVDEPGYPAGDDREEIADFCDAEVRFGLDYAIAHPDRDPAEVERLRERVEHWLEYEYSPYGGDAFIQQIARDLGLGDRMVMAMDPEGRTQGWMIARPEDDGAPVTLPAEPPWPVRRIRKPRGPFPRTRFLRIPGKPGTPPPFNGGQAARPDARRPDSS